MMAPLFTLEKAVNRKWTPIHANLEGLIKINPLTQWVNRLVREQCLLDA